MSDSSLAIGIDIGGTKTGIGLVSTDGRIVRQEKFPTDSKLGIASIGERITRCIRSLCSQEQVSWESLGGVGIGCPGPMNRQTGEIMNPHTLPGWEQGSLTEAIRESLPLPTALENDADAALLGECLAGAGKGTRHAVMLTFGTGVGGAALVGGRILRGVDDEHPEIGLIPTLPSEPVDYSGVPGSLESLASGTGIAKAGKRCGFPDCPAVFTAAAEKDPNAGEILEKASTAIALACLGLAHTLCPERIILGGGIMDDHFDSLTAQAQEAIARGTLLPTGKIKIVRAQLGNQAGLVGAASLCFRADSQ